MGLGNLFCFTIYGGNRALLVAANSQEEKDKWIEDINQAVESARELSDDTSRINYFSLKSCSSSEEVLDKNGIGEEPNVGACGRERSQQQRSNTTVHVCWHRNTSISTRDHLLALENQLSVTCCANSKTATAGKSCGSCSPTSVCFSTKLFKMISRWPVFLCWVIR